AEETLLKVIFDPMVAPKRVNQADGEDLVKTSACNYYLNVSQQDAEAFYNAMKDENDTTPPSYGMNSRLVKKDGEVYEEVWKVGGKYSDKIEKIVYWLEQAKPYAENAKQKDVIETLVEFYKTGDLKTFDEYSIKWVGDTDSRVDFVNGFIETYGDPLDMKASWESIVNFKNIEATRRTQILSENAQWFEDHSPVSSEFKKKEVKGVSAKVITMAFLGGDCYPATPIGINLPNANWIRQMHGSKSVTIENITNAYDKAAQGNGFAEEFMLSDEEIERSKKYAYIADNLHTDLHECLGHGSGQLLPGVSREALKAYGSTIEEARADLFGLYYTADSKILELGLLPAKDAYKAEYYSYIMNGLLTQLIRIKPGDVIEEAHMRNRALIARWAYEKGKKDNVIELVKKDGKTYVKINSYKELRKLFGVLLAEVQRIRSVGDYEAAKRLVEDYGVQIDPDLHNEVLERYRKLNLSPYKGFVNPVYELVKDENGNTVDVKVTYGEDFLHQQLRYDGFLK
ncbi:MAG: dihydrofolate reductase, partial [Paludibacteraceae bacterium]|nr:dihydrofolate reductase [Paludibacteraceae bacterium]